MTTTHELARKLLAGPDKAVILVVACPQDTVFGTDDEGKATDVVLDNEQQPDAVVLRTFVPEGTFGWSD